MTGLWLGWSCRYAGFVLRGHNAIARLSALCEMLRSTSWQLNAYFQFSGDFTCLSNCTNLIILTNKSWHIIEVCLTSVFLMVTL